MNSLQKKYMCYSFYDYHCVNKFIKNEITLCATDTTSPYSIYKAIQIEDRIVFMTNEIGIFCIYGKIADRIRIMAIQRKKLLDFLSVFDKIIIKLHIEAISIIHNSYYMELVFYKLCSYFHTLEKKFIINNIADLYSDQINIYVLKKLIYYYFNAVVNKVKKLYIGNKYYKEYYSNQIIGQNFTLYKSKLGSLSRSILICGIEFICNENNFNKIIYNKTQKKRNTEIFTNSQIIF